MINWLILLVKQFIDIIKYLLIADALFDLKWNKYQKIKEIIILSVLIIITYLLLFNYIIDIWIDLNLVICLIFLVVVLRNKPSITFKYIVVSLIITTLVEMFVGLFFCDKQFEVQSKYFIISNIARFIAILIIYIFIKLMKILYVDITSNKITNYIYMNMVFGFSATLFPLYIVLIYKNVISNRIGYIIIFIAMLNVVISAISIAFFIKNKNEKDKYYLEGLIKDQTIKLQEDYYQKLIANYTNIRSFKHDVKAHHHILNNLLENHSYEEAKLYLKKMSDKISSSDLYNTNNIYISTILNSFDQMFKENNIKFTFTYNVNNSLNMDNMDICSLFHNLIINTIEANIKITSNRFISLTITSIKNNLLIKLVNPIINEDELIYLMEMKSSKSDSENHGVGLKIINDIIEKYNGKNDYQIEDNLLINTIVLLNVVNY